MTCAVEQYGSLKAKNAVVKPEYSIYSLLITQTQCVHCAVRAVSVRVIYQHELLFGHASCTCIFLLQ